MVSPAWPSRDQILTPLQSGQTTRIPSPRRTVVRARSRRISPGRAHAQSRACCRTGLIQFRDMSRIISSMALGRSVQGKMRGSVVADLSIFSGFLRSLDGRMGRKTWCHSTVVGYASIVCKIGMSRVKVRDIPLTMPQMPYIFAFALFMLFAGFTFPRAIGGCGG
jgi:hypothetical protein